MRYLLTLALISVAIALGTCDPVSAISSNTVPTGWTALPLGTNDPAILCKTFKDTTTIPLGPGVVGYESDSFSSWQNDSSASHAVGASAALQSLFSLKFDYGGSSVSSLTLDTLQVWAPHNITDCRLDGGRFISAALKVGTFNGTVSQQSGVMPTASTTPTASTSPTASASPTASPSTTPSASPNQTNVVICPTSGGDATGIFSQAIKTAVQGVCNVIGSPQFTISSKSGQSTVEAGSNLFIAVQLIHPQLTTQGRSGLTASGQWNGQPYARVVDRTGTHAGYILNVTSVDPATYHSGDLVHLARHFCVNINVARDNDPNANGSVIFCPPGSMIFEDGSAQQLGAWDPYDAPAEQSPLNRPAMYYYSQDGGQLLLTQVFLSIDSPSKFTFVGYPSGGMPPVSHVSANITLTEQVYQLR
jgi:hypothetical protein